MTMILLLVLKLWIIILLVVLGQMACTPYSYEEMTLWLILYYGNAYIATHNVTHNFY